jgi:hypothetical protein
MKKIISIDMSASIGEYQLIKTEESYRIIPKKSGYDVELERPFQVYSKFSFTEPNEALSEVQSVHSYALKHSEKMGPRHIRIKFTSGNWLKIFQNDIHEEGSQDGTTVESAVLYYATGNEWKYAFDIYFKNRGRLYSGSYYPAAENNYAVSTMYGCLVNCKFCSVPQRGESMTVDAVDEQLRFLDSYVKHIRLAMEAHREDGGSSKLEHRSRNLEIFMGSRPIKEVFVRVGDLFMNENMKQILEKSILDPAVPGTSLYRLNTVFPFIPLDHEAASNPILEASPAIDGSNMREYIDFLEKNPLALPKIRLYISIHSLSDIFRTTTAELPLATFQQVRDGILNLKSIYEKYGVKFVTPTLTFALWKSTIENFDRDIGAFQSFFPNDLVGLRLNKGMDANPLSRESNELTAEEHAELVDNFRRIGYFTVGEYFNPTEGVFGLLGAQLFSKHRTLRAIPNRAVQLPTAISPQYTASTQADHKEFSLPDIEDLLGSSCDTDALIGSRDVF